MRILCDFINGSEYWQDKVVASATQGGLVLSDPAFLDAVAAVPKFDFCDQTPAQVADVIRMAGDVMIKVGFYRGWWWSKVLASESDGQVSFNIRKESVGAGGVENVCHELMHKLGFSHNGNSPVGQENTVPWLVGVMAANWVIKAPTAPKIEVEAIS